MNCERVAERLPWFLNQTLKPSERQAVEGHLAACDSCRRELHETKTAAGIFAQHIPHDVLVDFAFAQCHSRISEERVRQHLEGCPACRDDLSLIRHSEVSMYEEEDRPAVGAAPHAPKRVGRRAGATTWWVAAAATLVGAVLGLSWDRSWLTPQEVSPGHQAGVQVGGQVIDLFSDQEVRRSDTSDVTVVRKSSTPVTLVLVSNLTDEMQPMVEVVGDNGRSIFDSSDLVFTQDHDYILILQPDKLSAGYHEVRLTGSDNGAEVLETFRFRVVE